MCISVVRRRKPLVINQCVHVFCLMSVTWFCKFSFFMVWKYLVSMGGGVECSGK